MKYLVVLAAVVVWVLAWPGIVLGFLWSIQRAGFTVGDRAMVRFSERVLDVLRPSRDR